MTGSAYKKAEKLSDDESDDGDNAIGPNLCLKASEKEQASVAEDFEQRAQMMKDKLEGKVL